MQYFSLQMLELKVALETFQTRVGRDAVPPYHAPVDSNNQHDPFLLATILTAKIRGSDIKTHLQKSAKLGCLFTLQLSSYSTLKQQILSGDIYFKLYFILTLIYKYYLKAHTHYSNSLSIAVILTIHRKRTLKNSIFKMFTYLLVLNSEGNQYRYPPLNNIWTLKHFSSSIFIPMVHIIVVQCFRSTLF